MGPPVRLNNRGERLIDRIQHGDKVTITDPHGKRTSGIAVMRSSMPDTWVINTGGRFGKPSLASDSNTVAVISRERGKR